MFQTIQPKQIFDPRFWQVTEENAAYWLAQLRKREWLDLLARIEPYHRLKQASKAEIASAVLAHWQFEVCHSRAAVLLRLRELDREKEQVLLIQFRHFESDWTRGVPEVLEPQIGGAPGIVNIACRLLCRCVK